MPLIKRSELTKQIPGIIAKNSNHIFLFFGERYLCKTAADELQQAFLTAQSGTVSSIDGDQENAMQTLHKILSFSLLPGLQIYRVNDTRLFLSKNTSESLWQKAEKAWLDKQTAQANKYLLQLAHTGGLSAEKGSLSELDTTQWQELFGFSRPDDLTWTDEILQQSPDSVKKQGEPDVIEHYIQAFSKPLPANNLLFLLAENVDKRKKIFTTIKEHGIIVDCTVSEGSNSAAQKVQKNVLLEMMQKTLQDYNKKIDNRALDILFERIGFHPVAVVMETEKLALYCDDRERIRLEDIDTIVGRSREEALFELTEHFSQRNLPATLITLHHLLDNGVHALAILATLRNHVRRLLVFKALQQRSAPRYSQNMNANTFQNDYLPQLKEEAKEWKELLGGHPYALYMNFSKASAYACTLLEKWLALILHTEFRLKGSGISEYILLDHLFMSLLAEKKQL